MSDSGADNSYGTELGAQEGRYALFLQYCLELPDPPKYCDSCNAALSICHSLNCKRGGLVTECHNELHDGVADLSGKAFTPNHVQNDPLVFAGCAVKRKKAKPARSKTTQSTQQKEVT